MKRLLVLAASLVVPLLCIWLALTLATLLVGPQPAAASTTQVGGLISSNTTWTASNSPYVVTDNVLVDTGVTLSIEPGVTVNFDSGKYLWVKGTLLAVGTAANRITFTSNKDNPAPGDWGGIAFTYESGAGSRLEYGVIEYGGALHTIEGFLTEAALSVAASHPTISRNVFINNRATAIWIRMMRDLNISLEVFPARPTISYNLIKNTTSNFGPPFLGGGAGFSVNQGVGVGFFWATLDFTGTISYNTIINNGFGVKFDNYPGQVSDAVRFNNVYNNAFYDVALTAAPKDQDFSTNYWGTIDSSLIVSHTYDFNDNFGLGKILYSPIQTSPVITAPLAPPSGVVTSVVGSNVSLSWSANVESDLVGYNVYRRPASDTAYQKLTTSVLTATGYQDSPVAYGTFYYAATAVDTSAEESWYSDPVGVTIQAPTPTATLTPLPTATSTPSPTATPSPTDTPMPTPLAVYLPIVTRASSGW